MAKGVNVVILIGHVGKDPECRAMPNGDAVVSFSIATTESWKDKTTGQQQERTEWHRIVAYKRLAEIIRDYVKKGSKVYINGSLRTKKWQNKDGVDQYTTEVIAGEMQMLDSRGGNSEGNYPRNESTLTTNDGQSASQAYTDFDDDIPF